MERYREAEQTLAKLLGWTPFISKSGYTDWESPKGSMFFTYPHWVTNSNDAFQLMLDHGLEVNIDKNKQHVKVRYSVGNTLGFWIEHFENYTPENMAISVRYAIVMAVTRKLEMEI